MVCLTKFNLLYPMSKQKIRGVVVGLLVVVLAAGVAAYGAKKSAARMSARPPITNSK